MISEPNQEQSPEPSRFISRLALHDKVMCALFIVGCLMLGSGIPSLLALQQTRVPVVKLPLGTGDYSLQVSDSTVGCMTKSSSQEHLSLHGRLNIITELAKEPSDISFEISLKTQPNSPEVSSFALKLVHEGDEATLTCNSPCKRLAYRFSPIHQGTLHTNRPLHWTIADNDERISAQTSSQILELTLRGLSLTLQSTGLHVSPTPKGDSCKLNGTAVPAGLVYDLFKIWKSTNS